MEQRHRQAGDYTVGWICALPIELAAAQEMLDEEDKSPTHDSPDDNLYTLGRIGGRIGGHNVVLTCLPAGQTGTQSAATVAARMRSKFKSIRFGLMVGIGGGVPNPKSDIRLGDVVISQPYLQHGGVVQYDFGKTGAGGHITRTGSLNAPPPVLLNAVSKLQALHHRGRSNLATYLSAFERLSNFSRNAAGLDILFEATYNHIGGAVCKQCSRKREVKRIPRKGQDVVIHYGTIASGNQVIKDGITRDRLSAELGGVMCFEMEAAGLMNSFPCLVIRGICDYADSHKNKKWQPYAAATTAACAKEILSVIPPSEVATTRTVNEAAIYEILRSAIDNLSVDRFLPMLSVLDQDKHISTIPRLDPDHPIFYWIFRNIDFKQWSTAQSFQVLWLSGLSERNIREVSSYIVGQEKNTGLYFFFSSRTESTVTACVHTLLSQIVRCSPTDRSLLIIRSFLHSLLGEAFKTEADPNWKEREFKEGDALDQNLQKLLKAPANELFTSLGVVLGDEQELCLSIVVDGLDKVEYRRGHFIRCVRAFVEYLQQRTSKVKILLTSRPLDEIKGLLDGLPCIEYDRERKECLASLQFNNTRYQKISTEHTGSFEWIWAHNEYRNWSASNFSKLLYIQGKPGSGKSTLTKYFNRNLLKREPAANSAIVARFFYSYREGELQKSHYNMLQSVLYDILNQDEAFFYHRFQTKYRAQRRGAIYVDWDYASLKEVLKSLQDYSVVRRLYLIIDAVDESEDRDRRDIINLLFELCFKIKSCIAKVFIASRPVGQLEVHRNQFHNFIRLQDETKYDISRFASFFLNRLNIRCLLVQAREYIVENAHGVFLWVELVGKELLDCEEQGYSEKQILKFLKQLPTELEDFYTRMLERMTRNKPNSNKDKLNIIDGVKMFQFVLFARCPLTVDQLRHALVIPDNLGTAFTPSDDFVQEDHLPSEHRIIYCGGNFLEIKPYHGNRTVQVMHQTVREFFLDPNGRVANSEFKIYEKDAHVYIAMACIRYLMLYAANTALAQRLPDIKSWTSEHFGDYAQYLNERPLANYALCHLIHHINGCQRDASIQSISSQFINELVRNPAVYLLESWVSSFLNKPLLGNKQRVAAKDFRNKVLHAAARSGFSTAAEVLLTAGADVNAKDRIGWTVLHLAADRGQEVVARLLVVEGKADVNAKDENGKTALHLAASGGHEAVARLLVVELKADVNAKDVNGWTALHLAASGGQEAVARLLVVELKVDVNAKDGNGWTALHRAADRGQEAAARLLVVELKADVNAKDGNGWTALHRAADGGQEAVVRLLVVELKADVNAKDGIGWTALHRAADRGQEAVARLLVVELKADVNAKDGNGKTALHRAADGGHEAVVRLLVVELKADVNAKDVNGWTALHLAAGGGQEAVARLLVVELKADVNAKDRSGWTALYLAAGGGHEAVVRFLVVEGKADVNAKDRSGWTALHRAADGGQEAVVRLLLVELKALSINDMTSHATPELAEPELWTFLSDFEHLSHKDTLQQQSKDPPAGDFENPSEDTDKTSEQDTSSEDLVADTDVEDHGDDGGYPEIDFDTFDEHWGDEEDEGRRRQQAHSRTLARAIGSRGAASSTSTDASAGNELEDTQALLHEASWLSRAQDGPDEMDEDED